MNNLCNCKQAPEGIAQWLHRGCMYLASQFWTGIPLPPSKQKCNCKQVEKFAKHNLSKLYIQITYEWQRTHVRTARCWLHLSVFAHMDWVFNLANVRQKCADQLFNGQVGFDQRLPVSYQSQELSFISNYHHASF